MGVGENGDDTQLSWINTELLEEIISSDLKKQVHVTNFEVTRAVPKGENYLSVLYRVAAEYKENEASTGTNKFYMIMKTLPEGELMQGFLEEMKGFEKEARMYTEVLPLMYQLVKNRKGKIDLFSARRLTCSKEDIIVMEDLKHLDYKMALRKEGLDLDHCKIALRSVARFHAASLAVHKSDPKLIESYTEGLYRDHEDKERRDLSKRTMNNNLEELASAVETWPGYEKYGDKLRKIIPNSTERMINIVKPKKNSFNVLNHGDCWVNNMLFHYNPENGKVDDVRFVDFQISRYSSPALDLHYFLCNCPNNDVRMHHKDTLLEEYHRELYEYCKVLKVESDVITLDQLKNEYEEKNFFGLLTACTVLCVIIADAESMPDTKDLTEKDMENNVFSRNAVRGRRFRDIFQKLLVYYDEKGLFECN